MTSDRGIRISDGDGRWPGFVHGEARRHTENSKGVPGFLCAAAQPFARQSHFAPTDHCSGQRKRALVARRAKTGRRASRCKVCSYP